MEKVVDFSTALQARSNGSPVRSLRSRGWSRRLVQRWLRGLQGACLRIEEGHESWLTGSSSAARPDAIVRIHDPRFYREVLLGGSLGAAEAWMLGYWSSPDPVAVIRLMAANIDHLNAFDNRQSLLTRWGLSLFEAVRANTRRGSRRNIAAHYDLGNDFFALFLDADMMYSAAIYPHAAAGLEAASLHKRDHICRRLQLKPADHLLEIGTGWGGMAIHAAQRYGCRVTTVTISREQYEHALARVESQGLSGQVEVRLCDYRDLEGQYDKLVSIEMIEAVGHRFMPVFFETCQRLLKPEGRMLVQAITIPDQRYDESRKRVDFIRRYIFPGGCLPSIARMQDVTATRTDFQWVNLEDITDGYAQTLADWRSRFHRQVDVVRAQGFDEVFIRMWDFYLAYCEGGFRERAITTHQLLLARPGYRLG